MDSTFCGGVMILAFDQVGSQQHLDYHGLLFAKTVGGRVRGQVPNDLRSYRDVDKKGSTTHASRIGRGFVESQLSLTEDGTDLIFWRWRGTLVPPSVLPTFPGYDVVLAVEDFPAAVWQGRTVPSVGIGDVIHNGSSIR